MKPKKFFVRQNRFGNIRAFYGRRAIKSFGGSAFDTRMWANRVIDMGHSVVGLWYIFDVQER